jgi:hypothetical protein
MGNMSASDAAPLPRLGEVFFDVRGASRSMRLSWYANTGVAVFSIWQGGTCTGTFRLPIDDLPRMVEALHRGPHGRSAGQPKSPPAPSAQPAGPGREAWAAQDGPPQPDNEVETGQTTAAIQVPQAAPGYGQQGAAPQRGGELPAPRHGQEPIPLRRSGELPPSRYGHEPAALGSGELPPAGYGHGPGALGSGELPPAGYGHGPGALGRGELPPAGHRHEPVPPQRGGDLPAAGFGEAAPPHAGELPPVGYGLEPATGLQDQQFPAGYGEETARGFGEEVPRGYGERPAAGFGADPLAADHRPGGQTPAAYPDDLIPSQERAAGRHGADPLSAEYPAGSASRGYLEPSQQGSYPDPAPTHGHRRDSPARPYVAPPRTSAEESSGAPSRGSRRREADEPSPESFPYGPPPEEPDPRQRRRYPGRH